MKKTLLLTMEVDVEDLKAEERRECAEIDGISVRNLPGLRDADAFELADLIVGGADGDFGGVFEGSGMFCRFTAARLNSYAFKE